MRRTFKIILPVSALLAMVILLLQCKQPYVSPYASPATGYLVVEGYISGNGSTSFRLSRTIKLSGDTTNPVENGASVQVEGDDNSTYPLTGQAGGIYNTGLLTLNAGVNYRLRVHTQSGGEYLSDYVPFKATPAIDSVNWIRNSNGVDIYVNTHNDAGTTRYYQWYYDQTWEYHAGETSYYEVVPGSDPISIIARPPADQAYRCWRNNSSSSILINNSVKLAKDEIYLQPLTHIQADNEPLSVLYSIQVRQYALTEDGYNFLNLMKKNTESLGSIFDVQPSELKGNIHCLSNPKEQVIGFVSAGTIQQQRIFISGAQVSPWRYFFTCQAKDTVVPNNPEQLKYFFGTGAYIPIDMHYNMFGFDGWIANEPYCVDCRSQGGSNVPPVFWPN
jgi:hypothetical protein